MLEPLATENFRLLVADETLHIGDLEVTSVRGLHAIIHEDFPPEENIGVVLTSVGGPRFFHPGDSYEQVPPNIDVLAVPISSPWGKLAEAVEFVRSVQPTSVFPIHDALLSEEGKKLFWSWIPMLAGNLVHSINPEEGSVSEYGQFGDVLPAVA